MKRLRDSLLRHSESNGSTDFRYFVWALMVLCATAAVGFLISTPIFG